MNSFSFPMRSLLFVPGNNSKFISKAFDSDSDVLVFDLEDSVQSKENKLEARILLRNKLKVINGKKIFIRINDIDSGEILDDLKELTLECVDGFMFPKVNNGSDVYFIDKLLYNYELNNNFEFGKFKIILIIESSSALVNLKDICNTSKRVVSLAFGSEDYLTDISGINDGNDSILFYARSLILNFARAHNLIPIDTVYLDVRDLSGLEKRLNTSKRLGFEGMLVLHPIQIPLVNIFYTPTTVEVNRAKKIIELSKSINQLGKGVFIVEGEFVGPPMIKSAEKILDRIRLFTE